jgi:hypothetical protein
MPAGPSTAIKWNDGYSERGITMHTQHALEFAECCDVWASAPVMSTRRRCEPNVFHDSGQHHGDARNHPEQGGNHPRPAAKLGGFVGNVLRSVRYTFGMHLCSSCVLFLDCARRRHHHRLLAAVPNLGPKPVACIGSSWWFFQEKSYVY